MDINKIKEKIAAIDAKLMEYPQLKELHKKVGFPIVYLLAGGLVFTLLMIYLFCGMQIIGTMVAVIYPAWESMKAIDSDNKEDDTLWLAYWVFYGAFKLIEPILDFFLTMVPMYEIAKILFFVWLYNPKLPGAFLLWDKLKPFVKQGSKYEQQARNSAGANLKRFQTGETTTN